MWLFSKLAGVRGDLGSLDLGKYYIDVSIDRSSCNSGFKIIQVVGFKIPRTYM